MKHLICDKFGAPLIRTDTLLNVINGSQLVVSAGTHAYLCDAGRFEGPFLPGVHQLETDVGFFRKGARGSNMTVFFISTQELYYCKWGTGKVLFKSPDIPITRTLRAPFSLCVRTSDYDLFVRKVLAFRPDASHETLDQFLIFFATDTIQAQIQKAVNFKSVTEVSLQDIATVCRRELLSFFHSYGIELVSVKIHELNIDANRALDDLEADTARLSLLFGNDRQLYLQYLALTQSNRNAGDVLALTGAFSQDDPAPDSWGGI